MGLIRREHTQGQQALPSLDTARGGRIYHRYPDLGRRSTVRFQTPSKACMAARGPDRRERRRVFCLYKDRLLAPESVTLSTSSGQPRRLPETSAKVAVAQRTP